MPNDYYEENEVDFNRGVLDISWKENSIRVVGWLSIEKLWIIVLSTIKVNQKVEEVIVLQVFKI